MENIYISPLAHRQLTEALERLGYTIKYTYPWEELAEPVAAHPDMQLCLLKGQLFRGEPSRVRRDYPGDVAYNALGLDRYFVHRLDATAPELLAAAKTLGLEPVNVRQGYTKCSTVAVDGGAVITADTGIASALESRGLAVLRIRPGYVALPGYDAGFLGGTSGRIGNAVWFNGDLSRHPDHLAIRTFIQHRGLTVVDFPGTELVDIGSIIAKEGL